MVTKRAKFAEKRSKPGRIHAVLGALGRDIAREIIPAGAVLPPEHELESRFGVGRGVVREAIKTLSGKGLVSVRPRHGTRVLPRRDWSLLDRDVLNWLVGEDKPDRKLLLAVQEVRLIIEPAAAALAAANATDADKELLREKLERMKAANAGHFDPVSADIAFHATILEISHNRFFHQLTPIIETALRFSIRLTNKVKGTLPDYEAHERIYRAIRNGNADVAFRSCRELIKEALMLVIKTDKASTP